MKNYKLDIVAKTLTITKDFNDKLNDNDKKTWEIFNRLTKDIKGLKIINRTHKTPTQYRTKSGEVVKGNQYKNLTFERMEIFMDGLPNGTEYRKSYDFLKKSAGAVNRSGYTTVRRWFEAQFPKFRTDPLSYYYNPVPVIKTAPYIAEIENKKSKLAVLAEDKEEFAS